MLSHSRSPHRSIFLRSVILPSLLLFIGSVTFFLIHIQFPREPNFDEFHYVPAARDLIQERKITELEHPPLAKYFISAGILIGGDKPFGWRLASALFGSLTLVGIFIWALLLFRRSSDAWFVAGITLVNHLLYVQARIAMLDTFMTTFMVWALLFFSASWWSENKRHPLLGDLARARVQKGLFLLCGISFGLAVATKWFALIPWFYCVSVFSVVRLMQSWRVRFAGGSAKDWYTPTLWKFVRKRDFLTTMFFVPLMVYFCAFIPMLFLNDPRLNLWDLPGLQLKMAKLIQQVSSAHPYASHWTDWALLIRPMWYSYINEGPNQEWTRGVFLVGNPLIMWGGLIGMIVCAWAWITKKSREGFLIFSIYCALYFSWALIPRPISFYYYYYPAALSLSLALGYFFQNYLRKFRWAFLSISTIIFIYFFPILAALRIPRDSFRKWMWFSNWI